MASVLSEILLEKPIIMGVINVSPNSFYKPVENIESMLREVEAMISAGAAIIDVGGEATNPNLSVEKDVPSVQQELDRVIPAIEAIKKHFDVFLSVDTSRAQVMREAVRVGANMINDQRALREPDALETAAELTVPICLMHFFKASHKPGTLSLERLFNQVMQELSESVKRCEQAGIARERLLIDPGFGQGEYYRKNCEENFYLLENLPRFNELGLPILVGWSRKSMIGDVLNVPPEKRLYGSIAAAVIAAMKGASVIRVHDVKETVDAIKIFQAMKRCQQREFV